MTIGFSVPTVAVSAFSATFVPGARASVLSATITPWRRAFKAGVRMSVLVPASIAGLTSGRAVSSAWVAGVRLLPSAAKSVRNGCWTTSDRVDVVSVEGDRAIVDSSAPGERSIAANVVAMFVNRSAFTWATGATVRMNASSVVNNLVNWVGGALRYAATGRRYDSNGGRSSNVAFSDDPRDARAYPRTPAGRARSPSASAG